MVAAALLTFAALGLLGPVPPVRYEYVPYAMDLPVTVFRGEWMLHGLLEAV